MDEPGIDHEGVCIGDTASPARKEIRDARPAPAPNGVVAHRLEDGDPRSISPKDARLFPDVFSRHRVYGWLQVRADELYDGARSRDTPRANTVPVDSDLPELDELTRAPAPEPEMRGDQTIDAISHSRYDETRGRFYLGHAAACRSGTSRFSRRSV
jgi:hypothetical protein